MHTGNSPAVTVITVVKNNPLGLKKTIESLKSQTFSSWRQVIVVDSLGGPTWEMAMQYETVDERISIFLEEAPGIYAAMNQGLKASETDYVWFMNGGDCFFSPHTIQTALNLITTKDTPLVLGGYSTGKSSEMYCFREKYFTYRDFATNVRWGCHQAMIFRTSDIRDHQGYSQNYKLVSDFKLVMSLSRDKKCFRSSVPFAVIEPGGISHTQIHQVLREKQAVRREFFSALGRPVLLGFALNIAIRTKILLRQVRFNIFKK